MKKILALILVLALAMTCAFALTACGDGDSYEKVQLVILTPDPTHDWAGSVGTFAVETAAVINAAGIIDATVQTASDAAGQITQINLITANQNYDAVVILPLDNTVEESLVDLVETGIPVLQFDRLISAVEDDTVANIAGDNYNIGWLTAERFVANGLTKTDTILILEGDDSSVPETRNAGFWDYLTEEAGWTTEEVNDAVNNLGATGWDRTTAQGMFEGWINAASDATITATNFIFVHDDPLAMGIFDALTSGNISEAKLAVFYAANVTLGSSAGALENYEVLAGTHADSDVNDAMDKLNDYFSVTYTPAMIIDSIWLMVDYLNGQSIEHDITLPCEMVDSDNVADFMAFGFGSSSSD